MYSKNTIRVLKTAGVILILLGVMLIYLRSHIDIQAITQPFEQMSQSATESVTGKDAEQQKKEKAEKDEKKKQESEERKDKVEDVKDKVGLTKAQNYYIKFKTFVQNMEQQITELPNKGLIVLALLALFTIKSFVAIVPVSFTCLLTAVIFPLWLAVLINIVGVSIIFTIKYFKGRRKETNSLKKIIARFGPLWDLIEDNSRGKGNGNPRLLVALRLIPVVPVNPISQLYGHMEFPFTKYLVLSIVGYIFKVITFTAVGANISDPFSAGFFIPIIVVLLASGLALLSTSFIFSYMRKHPPVNAAHTLLQEKSFYNRATPFGDAPAVSAPAVSAPSFNACNMTAASKVKTTPVSAAPMFAGPVFTNAQLLKLPRAEDRT